MPLQNRRQGRDLDPIAVTVVGGYLGAGKTTLVNHVLVNADETIAVIVNDFGDIDIDAALIDQRSETTLALANGCICCSLVEGFAAALDTIDAVRPRPQRLLIEASGVADPASVAAYGHRPGFRLEGVLVLADASTIVEKATDTYVGDVVLHQLRGADLVVLNKTDLHPEPEAVADWLRERCQAPVIAARDAAVPLDVLLAPAVDGQHRKVDTAPADLTFRRGAIELVQPIDREALLQILAGLAPSVVRAKGFAWVADEPERSVLVQRVGSRTTLTPWRPWDQMDRPPATHIVTIELKPKT